MSYPHERLIEKHSIQTNELPAEIKESIEKFKALNKSLVNPESDLDEREEVKLSKQLKALSQELSNEIKEYLDDEAEDDLPESEINENIIAGLGKATTTTQELKRLGFVGANKLSMSFRLKVGKYILVKKIGSDTVRIEH